MKIGIFTIILCLILTVSIGATNGLKYNLTYVFRMDMKGKIAYVVSYRFYYESSASVNFTAHDMGNGNLEFCYAGVQGPGYVITTGGRTGTSLYFFTADTDTMRGMEFREKGIEEFKNMNPYYKKRIQHVRRRPMAILYNGEEALTFRRDERGVHSNAKVNMELTDSMSNTYSNIYKILGEIINVYNHSFLPPEGLEMLESKTDMVWQSNLLEFSRVLGRTARLTSEFAEKNADFKQKARFRVTYRVTRIDDKYIELCGDASPKRVVIWKNMRIREVLRNVRIRLADDVVVSDVISLNFLDKKGKGGMVDLELKLID